MEQSFWRSNRNRNCRVAFGIVNGARPEFGRKLKLAATGNEKVAAGFSLRMLMQV